MHPYIRIGNKTIASYGLCMVTGIVLATAVSCIRAKKRALPPEDVLIYAGCIVGCALSGAKLLFILVTFGVHESIGMIMNGNYQKLFVDSGFVFLGGLLGGIGGGFLGQVISRTRMTDFYSSIVPTIPLGHAVGRIGCFLGGCCYGKAYTGFGAVHFPDSIVGLSPDEYVIPVQLIEAAWNLIICFILIQLAKEIKEEKNLLLDYFIMYSVMRFFVEFLRGDNIRGIYLCLSTSQWLSLGIMIVCLFLSHSVRHQW